MKFIRLFIITLSLAVLLFTIQSCSVSGTADGGASTTEFTLNDPEDLIVILHAGGSADGITHLNAQETFEHYYLLGYRYFEYDLRLSSDGRLIATHAWEHLNISSTDPTYQEFKELRLSNGYTPVNEEWIVETIVSHPDVNFVIDAKMDTTDGDSAVVERLEELEEIYDIDLSGNIIPEIFSKEMWDICKETTTFDRYFFSHYKVYYTVDTMLEYFNDDRVWGFALPTYTDADILSQLYRAKKTKKIFFFTPSSTDEIIDAAKAGADGVYLDFVELIK